MSDSTHAGIAFIGGGNMASALIGGLLQAGHPAAAIEVVEPSEAAQVSLAQRFGVQVQAAASPALARAALVVWAVKPQLFAEAAGPCAPHVGQALQLSVMAGVRSDTLVAATGSARVVRSMPNTPALIGEGIAGLYARPEVTAADREMVTQVMSPTGALEWVPQETDLDAVTALSGSGPAYVFYFLEAMIQAGSEMGLEPAQARRLAQATFSGAAALATQSDEAPQVLRERVTSKGGTTFAALTSLETDGVKAAFVKALHAARDRAEALGRAG